MTFAVGSVLIILGLLAGCALGAWIASFTIDPGIDDHDTEALKEQENPDLRKAAWDVCQQPTSETLRALKRAVGFGQGGK